MARYVDPIDTIYIDAPGGFCLDRFSSSLTHLVFLPWNRPAESLHVDVGPQELVAEAPSKQWLDEITGSLPPDTPLTYLECSEGMAVAATVRGARSVTRLAFVRGLRLAATVEHRGAGDDPSSLDILRHAARTLFIPLNHHLPPPVERARIGQSQEACKAALMAGDTLAAVKAMKSSLDDSRLVWLASLAAENELPDLDAAISVVTALCTLGKIGRDVVLLRQAEEIVLRMPGMMKRLPLSESHARGLAQTCGKLLSVLATLHSTVIGKPDRGSPLGRLDARADYLFAQAAGAAEAGDARSAAANAEIAVQDYLLELAQLGKNVLHAGDARIDEDGVQVLKADALKSDVRQVARRACVAGHFAYLGAMDRQDAPRALETSALGLALSQQVMAGVPSESDRISHVTSMLAYAGALLFSADRVGLQEADAMLARVREELDALPSNPVLRVDYCRDHAWVKLYLKELSAGRALCDEGLAALATIPADSKTDVGRSRRALMSLRSQCLLADGLIGEALDCARDAADTPAPLSTHLLNLSICEERAGLGAEALASLRRALEVALSDNPLGQDVLRILFLASAFAEHQNPAVALDLHDAAEALLDAQRERFTGMDTRVAFDESEHHREVAQTLVGRLIAANDLGGALEAADRSRARVLIELLDAPPRAVAADGPEPVPPADHLDEAPILAFRHSALVVRRAAAVMLSAAGAPLPLDRVTLTATVQRTGRPALLYQPEGERVHMFCILPEQQVIVATSPLTLTEIDAAIGDAQAALGVFAVARARSAGRLKLADIDDDRSRTLNEALDTLSTALIAPITELLAQEGLLQLVLSDRGLTLLPYRQLALVPFALLRSPNDRMLIEEAPLSQMPSIASLRALVTRKRPPPRGCLVYGAPEVADRHGLEPLPGAAVEAERVATMLVQSGLVPPAFAARLGAEATGSAYRQDAADAGLVHLACHAATREPVATSALYLAPSPTHDGLLRPHEIADGQLANALVFLSACQTGLGRPTADGVIGLGRAFLQAGALAAVLSLWRVADAAAVELAQHFYRNALGIGGPSMPVATALQQAMLATRDALSAGVIRTADGEVLDDHPAHWAPFTLLGEASLDLRRTLSEIGART